jgi:hypothetical protein
VVEHGSSVAFDDLQHANAEIGGDGLRTFGDENEPGLLAGFEGTSFEPIAFEPPISEKADEPAPKPAVTSALERKKKQRDASGLELYYPEDDETAAPAAKAAPAAAPSKPVTPFPARTVVRPTPRPVLVGRPVSSTRNALVEDESIDDASFLPIWRRYPKAMGGAAAGAVAIVIVVIILVLRSTGSSSATPAASATETAPSARRDSVSDTPAPAPATPTPTAAAAAAPAPETVAAPPATTDTVVPTLPPMPGERPHASPASEDVARPVGPASLAPIERTDGGGNSPGRQRPTTFPASPSTPRPY